MKLNTYAIVKIQATYRIDEIFKQIIDMIVLEDEYINTYVVCEEYKALAKLFDSYRRKNGYLKNWRMDRDICSLDAKVKKDIFYYDDPSKDRFTPPRGSITFSDRGPDYTMTYEHILTINLFND